MHQRSLHWAAQALGGVQGRRQQQHEHHLEVELEQQLGRGLYIVGVTQQALQSGRAYSAIIQYRRLAPLASSLSSRCPPRDTTCQHAFAGAEVWQATRRRTQRSCWPWYRHTSSARESRREPGRLVAGR